MKNKKILCSGSSGFIGRHLVEELQNLGYSVRGFDIKNFEAEDIRFRPELRKIFKYYKPDIVIHLATLTGVRNSVKKPAEYFETNITGTYNMLDIASRSGVKKFIFFSSSSVYGDRKCPLKEDVICDNQLSPYAVSKITGELLCRMFKDLPTIIVRPFTVYGENPRKDQVIYKIIKAAKTGKVFQKFGDGNSIRGYTNVHDLIDGVIKLIDYKQKDNYEVFNLGGSEQVQLNKLIEIVKEKYSKLKVVQVERNLADVLNSYADITKAKKLLDWQPNKKFKDEILCLIKNLKETKKL